ncbi:alpha/beta fold hydrolase [Stutzerimonas nosocomialis]|nr:alpha/beta fold hydrolase [Stutzerimonas nosocomialis]
MSWPNAGTDWPRRPSRMRNRLILLPGWAFGEAALAPLRDALLERDSHLQVDILPLPDRAEPAEWLKSLDPQIPDGAWLAGWSLGGMLAARLAASRAERCRGLIGIASNLRFRSSEQWPTAMPAEIFDTFHQAFGLDPELTLKRFTLLVSRGAFDPKTLARQLQVSHAAMSPAALDAGLQLLAHLDNRDVLGAFAGPQLHLFAGRDALVPVAAADALQAEVPDVDIRIVDDASHGLPLEQPDTVARLMVRFMREGEDG